MPKSTLQHIFGKNTNLHFQQAPQPHEINWENINYPKNKKIIRIIFGWIIYIVFLGTALGIFYLILYQKSHLIQKAYQELQTNSQQQQVDHLNQIGLIVTIFSILLVIFFNKYILALVIHLIVDFQKHYTGSSQQFSLGLKYIIGLFFTTALMTLFVQNITLHNIYSYKFGLVQEQTIQLFFNALLVPLIWLLNLEAIYRTIKKWWNKGRKDMTQRQANKLMQNVQFLLESIWFVYMYSSLIPLGAPVMVVGLSISYWVSKYNLLRKSSVSENVNELMSYKMLKLLDLSLILRGTGDLIFDLQIRDGKIWVPLTFIILGFIYLIFPLNNLLDCLHDQKFKFEQKTFEQLKQNFKINYRTLHFLYTEQKMKILRRNSSIESLQRIIQIDHQ